MGPPARAAGRPLWLEVGFGGGEHLVHMAARYPGARLWAVRVLDSQGNGSLGTLVCGIEWVTAQADVIVHDHDLGLVAAMRGAGGRGGTRGGTIIAGIVRSSHIAVGIVRSMSLW